MKSGWTVQVRRADDAPTTESEERAVIIAAGCEPEERLNPGGWTIAIPDTWEQALTEPQGWDDQLVVVNGVEWYIELPE